MITFVFIFYLFMCFISNWDLLWPLTMLAKGGFGDQLIAIIWGILLIVALN